MIDPCQPDYTNTPASDCRPAYGYAPRDLAAPPLVTIMTPFYNTGTVFHETARSVFRQSWQQWEWVIINDASQDPAALAILDEYRHRDPRIRVIDNAQNLGVSATRNVGFANARAEYVYQLDDDDLIEPTALEKLYWFLETHPEFSVANGWEVGFGALEYLWNVGFERGPEHLRCNSSTSRAMIRRGAHAAVGGHDTELRGGGEDWDFWLRLADHGQWGGTIPEYLDWYRRRDSHSDRWENFGPKKRSFVASLRRKFPRLYDGGFPKIETPWHLPFERVRPPVRSVNPLVKNTPRLLLIVPWITLGGADKFNVDLIEQLTGRGWEVTVATTRPHDNPWLPRLAALTPDVFALPNFLRLSDFPAFLSYLVDSRQPDVVAVSGSELGYWLLPFLRAEHPEPVYVDYCHAEAPKWKNGGYARYAVGQQEWLDLNIVSSEYLKGWLVERGAAAERIEVMYINVDADAWKPDAAVRQRVRREYGISEDTPVICFAGRLHEEKQPDVLVATLHELARRDLSFHALIAGDGPEQSRIASYIVDHDLAGHVTLLGGVPSERVREVMAASDIFFLPSMWEGVALSIYEAMASGLVVVGADVGGQRELLTPECGLLLPKRTPQQETRAYADALANLLGDTDGRAAMGRSARERVCASFTLDAMGARFVELIEVARGWQRRAPRTRLSRPSALESATQAVEYARLDQAMDALWVEAADHRARQDALEGLTHTAEYKLAQRLARLRRRLLPAGGRRERGVRWLVHKLRRVRYHAGQGPGALAWAALRWLRRRVPRRASGARRVRRAAALPARVVDPWGGVTGLVSVVLPVYNQADLLAEAIDSVLAQTYQDFELIIINDGSTDDVEEVLNAYVGAPRVRVLTQPNQTLPRALSNAFDMARGEFWTWTSADNVMEPRHLERLVSFLQQHPHTGMVYADYLAIDDRGQPLRDPGFRPQNRHPHDAPEVHLPRSTETLNSCGDNFIGGCFLYRGWIGRLLGDYTPSLGVEDYDYWMRLNRVLPIRHLGTDELLYRYRVHDNTLNARAAEHRIAERLERLMRLEERRASLSERPWTIYADRATREWLDRITTGPHRVHEFDGAGASPNAADKCIVWLDESTVQSAARLELPAQAVVLATFHSDSKRPYALGREQARVIDLCFAEDPLTRDRLSIFTPMVFMTPPDRSRLDLAVAFANDALSRRAALPAEEWARATPDVHVPIEQPVRVLMQADHFLQGGLEQVILDIAQVLDPHRFDLTLLVLGELGPAVDKARARGIEVVQLPAEDRSTAYRRLIDERQIDVINAHYSLFGAAIAAEAGIPFVQTIHNMYAWLSDSEVAALHENDAHTSAYVAVSSAVAAYADFCLELPPEKLHVVPNGVDVAGLQRVRHNLDRSAERRRLGFGEREFVFLCAASIAEVKGQRMLVEALARVVAEEPQARVALLGRPQSRDAANGYARALEEDIDRLGLRSAVHFLGYHTDVHPFYLAADAFVLPSFIEGWSLSLAEALAAGLPTIATDVGAARALLESIGGTLLPAPLDLFSRHDGPAFCDAVRQAYPDHIDALAAAMLATLREPRPPRLTAATLAALDRHTAYSAYDPIYAWLAQGGTPMAVRAWLHSRATRPPQSTPIATSPTPEVCQTRRQRSRTSSAVG